MRCGFAAGGNLQWLDIYYDEGELQRQVIIILIIINDYF